VLGLKAGLAEQGLQEGREVLFESVHTRGQLDTLQAGVAGLVQAKVDVIFAALESPTRAAMNATSTIPIVFAQIGDPVAAGIAKSMAHPGSNVTGVSGLTTDLAPKRLEALKSCAPALKRVWAVYAHDDLSSAASARKASEAASALRLEILARPVRSSEEAVSVLKTVPRADGLLAPTAVSLDITARVLDLGPFVPGVFDTPYWVQGGGLVAYGVDHEVQGRQAARLVARILRGARPEDLPVENSTKFELAVNLKTAKALGLTIPQSLLARADRLVQ
jgi:putative ABC transport system substrate-binding protein